MAPSRTSTVKNKHASKHAANKSGIRNSKTSSSKTQPDGVSKAKSKKALQAKTKTNSVDKKKKRRVYSERELNIPALNMVTPIGVEKPRGKKKGKIFVDDRESMMTILAMVNADKEGQIESKMMKARQMEEIREARKVEAEKRQEIRKSKLDETKEGLRKKRKRAAAGDEEGNADVREQAMAGMRPLRQKKSVSFA